MLLAIHCSVKGQTQGNLVLDIYSNQKEIKASKSIILKPGFHIPKLSEGNSVRIFIGANFQECVDLLSVPSTNQNYILTRTFKVSDVKTEADLKVQRKVCDENQSIQYFDGLGRTIQTVMVMGSPGFRDLVQPIAYDAFGRETKTYLPYVSASTVGSGSYKTTAITDQDTFYKNPSGGVVPIPSAAFAETKFEASPLNRILEQGAPGADWQLSAGHTQKISYGTNNSNLASATTGFAVRLYTAQAKGGTSPAYEKTLGGTGYYEVGQLYLTISKDENWVQANGKEGTTEEYKDKEGRVVLKRTFNKNASGTMETLSTYYVYDDLGNLSFVLPPGALADGVTIPSQTVQDNFCYQYRYDGRKRLIEKKLPGKGWEHMVYNKLDQLVLSQDVLQRGSNKWLFNKYDAFGRMLMTGIINSDLLRSAWETNINNQPELWEIRDDTNSNGLGTGTGYTNKALPAHNLVAYYYTINYYDDYKFYGNSFTGPLSGESGSVKSLLTGSKVNLLGAGAALSNTMRLSTNYYDAEGRVIRAKSQHHLDGTDEVFNTWNFAGELKASIRKHTAGSKITTIASRYEYDHVGRKLATIEQINSGPETVLSKLSYNEIGQLQKKELHSTDDGISYLQKTEYGYNERGWMNSSVSDQFSLNLKYNDGTIPQYNGNIANQNWGAGVNLSNKFVYGYDKLNRLISSNGTDSEMTEILSYDVMGNIKTMNRGGLGVGTYNYAGNQLTNITGAPLVTGTYVYDDNGNMTTDGRTGVKLTYNILNLPVTAVKPKVDLLYTYDATGRKLRKLSSGATRDYISGIEYNNGVIDIIQTEEGVARNNSGSYSYEYNLTDHLGNVRFSFNQHPDTKLLQGLQADNFYVFGKRKVVSAGPNKYLYNGKEVQEELGEQYDYGARFYDPVIGRFNTIDLLSEVSRRNGPYGYALNNPIRFVDVDGMYAGEAGNYNKGDKDFNDVLAYYGINNSQQEQNNEGGPGDKEKKKNDPQKKETTFGLNVDYKKIMSQAGKAGTALWGIATAYELQGEVDSKVLFDLGYRKGSLGNYLLKGRNLSLFGGQNMTSATMPISNATKFGGVLGKISTYVSIGVLAYEGREVYNGNLDGGRFGYHLTNFGASAGTGLLFGGPAGFTLGLGASSAEVTYDTSKSVLMILTGQWNNFINLGGR